MPNKAVFNTRAAAMTPADTTNEAGGRAYTMSAKQALAQFAVTGCFNDTYYVEARDQLSQINDLLSQVEPEYVAKLAIYSRASGYMKDMPAFLTAYLAVQHPKREDLLKEVFSVVVDNGKMLRNVMTFVRSDPFHWRGLNGLDTGAPRKRSFPNPLRRLIKGWFAQPANRIFYASVGNDPSMADMLRMVHPKPASPEHNALFARLLGKEHDREALPSLVKEFEAFKANPSGDTVPKVPFQMITGIDGLPQDVWKGIARNAKWMMTRMNLNTFARHGVFDDPAMVDLIAARLRDAEQIRKARQFPYQMFVAYQNAGDSVPFAVRDALHDALDVALSNVPAIPGNVVICPDCSGSMRDGYATGRRGSATSVVRCIDVAALIASAFLRVNRSARVIPFEQQVCPIELEPRDTVMTNASKLAAIGGGGTACSAPLCLLNGQRAKVDVVIFVSDYESWVDSYGWERSRSIYGTPTKMADEWKTLKRRNPGAKMVCIDLTPNRTAQVTPSGDILQVGGFSDAVFDVVASFCSSPSRDHWLKTIEGVVI